MQFLLTLETTDNKFYLNEKNNLGWDVIKDIISEHPSIDIKNIYDTRSCFYSFGIEIKNIDILERCGLFNSKTNITINVPEYFMTRYFEEKIKIEEKYLYPNWFFMEYGIQLFGKKVPYKAFIKTVLNEEAFLRDWEKLGFPTTITNEDLLNLNHKGIDTYA